MNIDSQPRIRLGRTPTPLHDVPRLREALGGTASCPRILFKRDDLTDLALGGNKARKLEFLLGDASARGATALVTTGGPQSNHARMTAAAASLCGMKCVLILSGPGPRAAVGNLLLDLLLNAQVRLLDVTLSGSDAEEAEQVALVRAMNALHAEGERAYMIPLGGSNALGTLGYAVATDEMLQQLAEMEMQPTRLYHASGSRGTQAGLELGARLFDAPWRVTGIAVSPGEQQKRQRAAQLILDAAELIGANVHVDLDELHTDENYFGDGYAVPTASANEAIALVARTEGIFLDPVYTGKAMAGLIDHIRKGVILPDETVVFLHTGGVPGLFAMGEAVLSTE
jgi:D-cysteine desulfhydrase family pyridoxal phosphate-dependent enzyme